MHKLLPAVLLLSVLLAACASDKDALKTKDIAPDGVLKVHPALLGAPVASPTEQVASPPASVTPAKTDPAEPPVEQSTLR